MKQPPPIKAPPVPHFGLPFQPHLPEEHQVEVCPFSFEEREQERRALKEKKLEEWRLEKVNVSKEPPSPAPQGALSRGGSHLLLQAQVPQFKAQPLPDFDTVVLPEKKKLEATKPEPFRLLVDQRGAAKSTQLEKMVRPAPPPPPSPAGLSASRLKMPVGILFFR